MDIFFMITDEDIEAIWDALKDLSNRLEALEAKVEGLKLVAGVLADRILPRI